MRAHVMKWMVLAVSTVFTLGCGRIGFPPSESSADASPDVAPPQVCAAARRGTIDSAGAGDWVTGMVGVATSAGFELSYIAPDGAVFGTTYAATEPFAPAVNQAVIDKKLGSGKASALGVLVQGGRILVAWSDGTNTEFERLNDSLAAVGNAGSMAHTLIEVPLATSGTGPTLALAYQTCGCGEISASQIDIDGAVIGATGIIAAGSETPSGGAILAAHTGYLATWIADSPARAVRGQLLDASFGPVSPVRTFAGPITASVRSVRSAWSVATSSYLVSWEEAGAVRGVITDANLAPRGSPFQIASSGTKPRVASDARGFWVAWNDSTAATHLAMAFIDPAGSVKPVAVTGSGGTMIDYNLVTVGGVAQLVWVERGGGSGNLWIVPACTAS